MKFRLGVLLLVLCTGLSAHVGSPDVFLEGQAGPYSLSVVVRPPSIVPGVAEVEVLLRGGAAGDIRKIEIQPVTYSTQNLGAPVPDELRRSASDPKFFTGQVWFMGTGSYSIRVLVDGAQGAGKLNVPVPSVSKTVKDMPRSLGAILFALLLLLVAGAVSVVGAAWREGQLPPGQSPDAAHRRRARLVMAVGFAASLGAAGFGYSWWDSEADRFAQNIYTPMPMSPTVANDGLTLTLAGARWRAAHPKDDFVEDHGHLMHTFLIRIPDLDAFYHLHPEKKTGYVYEKRLPALPQGRYKIFADIVHQSGFPETLSSEVALAEVKTGALEGDDSRATPQPAGFKITWDRPAELVTRRAVSLTFHVEGDELEPYMGMAGHLVVVKKDLSVMAHLHPGGSAPMASIMAFKAEHAMPSGAVSPEISFPYGFPQPGSYRLWLQVKHRGKVETGVFDCEVR